MTRFKNIPLFGPDSSPQNTSEKLGLIITASFWLVLLICFAFIKPIEKKPKYKEVQIVLSSTPVKKQSEESPAPAAPAPVKSSESTTEVPEALPVVEAVSTPVKEVVKETPKVAETPKSSVNSKPKPVEEKKVSKPAAKTPAPAKVEEPVIYKSVEDLMAEQLANKKSSKNADFDPFAQFDDTSFEDTQTVSKIVENNGPAFSGSAATSATGSNQPVKSTSVNNKTSNQTTTTATSNALGKITNAKVFGTSTSFVDTEATVQTAASGNGKVSMVMDNGSSRVLLEPEKPIINLSETAAATIDGSRKVSISFTVTESGNVPRGEIVITPESILAEIVRKEIRDQLSKWRFEAADYTSKATFEYKIVKYMD